jgi:hypothetical protein
MILPQDKQLGAVANSGCIDALQGHLRRSVESDGFVESSSAAIADVKSLMLEVVVVADLNGVDAPECAGFLDCFVLTLGRSDIKLPEADGGSFCLGGEGSLEDEGDGEWRFWLVLGSWRAVGSCDRANAFDIEVAMGVGPARLWP